MTKLIIKLFIKDYKNTSNPAVRARYGYVSSIVGIVCNLFLSTGKFILGAISGSIAITADAVNNLSDIGSALVTLIGFKLASKPADREHPYGHGRVEYIAGLIVSFFILLVGFEILKNSAVKILHPAPVTFSMAVVIGLVVSILVKFWMNRFNNTAGKMISSAAMCAVATDSIADVLATSATLIAVIASKFTPLPLDGAMGVIVSLVILYAGFNIAKDTLSPLLGLAPDPELVQKIKTMALSHDGILGVHDLIVHEYGPGRVFASFHAEVSVDEEGMKSHGLIDSIETELSDALGIEMLIHMDPLETKCELTNEIHRRVQAAVHELDSSFEIHDFRVVLSGDYKNLVFDVAIPIEYKATNEDVKDQVSTAIKALDIYFNPKIVIDRN